MKGYHKKNEKNRTTEKTVRNKLRTRLKQPQISKIKYWTKWTDGQTDTQTDGRTDGRTDGQTDGQTDRQTDRHTDGRTGRRADGRTDRASSAVRPTETFFAIKRRFRDLYDILWVVEVIGLLQWIKKSNQYSIYRRFEDLDY